MHRNRIPAPRLCARPHFILGLLALLALELGCGAAPTAPTLFVDPGVPHANFAGDMELRWHAELNRRYRIESSTDLREWKPEGQVVGLDRDCRYVVKTRYTAATKDPEVRKFWRVTPFDFDSDGDSISDYDESRLGTDPFAGTRIPLRCHFVPFGLCLSNKFWTSTAAEQIAKCQSLGYTGYGLSSFGPVNILKGFADHPDVVAGRFRIYSALWWTDLKLAVDWAAVDLNLVQAARMDMAVWLVLGGTKSAADVATAYERLRLAAQHCHAAGVPLVLYPHQGTTYATAEQSLAVLLQLRADPAVAPAASANVSLSLHLCHELKAGNGPRIAEVVALTAPYCTLASVSGAEIDTKTRGNWETGIRPLDQGNYDVRPFLQALATAGYTGPMEYHTYNLPDPQYDDHLERTLIRWRQLVAPPAP
jgi:sugar phosphate isomerase/epimerase